MAGPVWARWVFAMLFTAIGVYCAARLLAARHVPGAVRTPDDRAVEAARLLMTAGMTVMFLPVATPVPPAWWAAVFAVDSAWLGLRLLRPTREFTVPRLLRGRAHQITHVLAGAAMAYMFAMMPADGLSGSGVSHLGHLSASSPGFSVIGWVAVAYFLGHTVWCGIRVTAPGPCRDRDVRDEEAPGGPLARTAAPPGLPLQLFMGLGMAYMLMTML